MTDAPLLGPVDAPDLSVMSLNIRRAMEGVLRPRRDRWSTRAPAVSALLGTERPTLLGLQEALPRVLPVVHDALGPAYRRVGHGRGPGGSGEGTPLVYDSARLDLRASGQRALSPTPDQPGSLGWGNLIPRILVWAEFVDRATDEAFLVVNTHLDHLSARSRRLSVESIRNLIRDRALPAVVMGDLNAGEGSGAVRGLLSGGDLLDAWRIAERTATPAWGTYPGYGRPRRGARRIDWIAVTPDVRVRAIGLNPRKFEGRRPSDHLAVQSILRLGEEPS